MHRRQEMEARTQIFHEKCDRAVEDIKRLKLKTDGFAHQLNCDPNELKERFLNCMKQLDEYMYLITDFNIAISKLEEASIPDNTPVHDTAAKPLTPTPTAPYNLMDALSEPAPSTSTTCSNNCPPEKPKRVKIPKENQSLIVFSSTSASEESVRHMKNEVAVKEVQCELDAELRNIKIEDPPASAVATPSSDSINLPAQPILETEHVYDATIMHVDGAFFWVITEDPDEVKNLMIEMTKFYSDHHRDITADEVKTLTCCAFYDDDSKCYYRGLFLKLNDEDNTLAEIFVVDTGEMRGAPVECVQPLYRRFCTRPPYARCCHLAGVDLVSYNNKSLMEKQEVFMSAYVGTQASIEVDDNTSESLGVFVILPSGETLNKIIVQQGLALPIDKLAGDLAAAGPSDGLDITDCPEYDDPVEAVTGYKNRDEIDICKHYKGGPEKTCFKGARCTKKHILKHPDGWTLDRIAVMGKCKSIPLPAPDTWLKVLVTNVCHYDRVYVQIIDENETDEVPSFGVVLPATTLTALVRDMNSLATIAAYKPLTVAPAQGELVAALYPLDNKWYRARVLSVTRADQTVEVQYLDYGTVMWVKEDQLRVLEARHVSLPAQAVRAALAGVRARSHHSHQWAQAKRALADMLHDAVLDAHVIAREYDEITVELFDKEGYSIAEQLAAINMVELTSYSVVFDTEMQKVVVP
ncbi:unnamed protein product [Spodoptera littoralis]|uniref:Tudor domain-containing protein n=1 Tax=Spodoptera littoralis TaxID=7109 RepID=A0A9P0N8S9_SPOLI|nr:unnamed protein product [Spodoptera littoralis]CAH1645665.1 unnamed protein product [Spodoptera littoralis]